MEMQVAASCTRGRGRGNRWTGRGCRPALGVNCRTMMNCYDFRRVSQRMRQALEEFRYSGGVADDEPGDVDGDYPEDIRSESLGLRVAAQEADNRGCGNWWRTRAASWRSWSAGWPRWKGPGSKTTMKRRLILAVTRAGGGGLLN